MEIGIISFVFTVGADLSDSVQIGEWIYCFPHSDEFQELKITENQDGESEYSSGMTKTYKAMMFLLVLLPKLAIAFCLLYFGCGLLMVTDDNSVCL